VNLWTALRVALRALIKNKMRASLTVLGIVIGIAAVTAMVSIGQSASRLVAGQFESFGANMIVVFPAHQRSGRGVRGSRQSVQALTSDDSDALRDTCPEIIAASPLIFSGGQIIYGNSNWNPNEMIGVGVDYLSIRNLDIRFGSFFSESNIVSASKVCVIGHTIVAKLFQTSNPIGKTIRVRNVPLKIIGILEAKGANMFGEDQDNLILMPYSTARKRLIGVNFRFVHAIMASARNVDVMAEAEQQARQLLRERHRIPPGERADFEVKNTTEIKDMLGVITGTLTIMLSSIAGISLLVGGVGIMNIMLVSVTERTREIGVRMAVGARPRDILQQFLIESVLLSGFGGFVGFVLGVGGSVGVTNLINSFTQGTQWPVVISIPAAIVAIIFSAGVGVFFGFYPAWKASRLDPIDALRYE